MTWNILSFVSSSSNRAYGCCPIPQSWDRYAQSLCRFSVSNYTTGWVCMISGSSSGILTGCWRYFIFLGLPFLIYSELTEIITKFHGRQRYVCGPTPSIVFAIFSRNISYVNLCRVRWSDLNTCSYLLRALVSYFWLRPRMSISPVAWSKSTGKNLRATRTMTPKDQEYDTFLESALVDGCIVRPQKFIWYEW